MWQREAKNPGKKSLKRSGQVLRNSSKRIYQVPKQRTARQTVWLPCWVLFREATALSSVQDAEGQAMEGQTWRGRQNQGFWVAFTGILAVTYHRKAQPTDNFLEGRPSELNAETCGETLNDEGNEVRTRKADQLECDPGKTRATSTWRDYVRIRNMGPAKLGPCDLRSPIRFQSSCWPGLQSVWRLNWGSIHFSAHSSGC